MMSADEFVDLFVDRMQSGYYKKDKQKNEDPELNEEYINRELKKVDKMLESDVIQEVLKGVGHE
ncbi:MAG: hypothetical protein J5819_04480 [Eubacterium sp.]|nr:hypothetical protein [Eubacterium sp.]